MLLPLPLLFSTLLGLLSVAVLAGSLGLLYRALRRYRSISRKPQHPRPYFRQAYNWSALADRAVWLPLVIGLALLFVAFAGRSLVHLAIASGGDEPKPLHSHDVRYLDRPDGTKIHAEIFGPANAPTLVLTHGWGTSNAEWYYVKRQLAGQFRLIIWDLPGLGDSTQPADRDFALEKMAADLDAVLSLANGKPVVLVGHSIGGMIDLTFCRLFPQALGHRVVGIAQLDTSYTNPVTTTKDSSESTSLQRPLAEPLLHAMIWFSPLVRAANWLSYRNGSTLVMNAQSSFAGSETWGQLDLVSRYSYESDPAVVARGTLAMLHWDAKPVLPRINVPVLILVGQQDTTTLPSASEFMHSNIRNSQLDTITPSAHYGLLEQNRQFNSAISLFAKSCFDSFR